MVRRDVEDEQTVRRYLLDDLSPEERRRLEERLLDDGDEFVDHLQIAENEIIDDYVTGELSENDRGRFREAFLFSPERHEQLRFTELLREHFAATGPLKKTVAGEGRTSPSWLQRFSQLLGLGKPAVGFALSCGLILAVGVAAWLGFRNYQLRRSLDRLQAQQSPPAVSPDETNRLQQELAEERARRESAARELSREQGLRAELERETDRLRGGDGGGAAARPRPERAIGRPPPHGAAAKVLAVTLTSGLVRDAGEVKTLTLRPETAVVRLRLDVGAEENKNYRAALETAEGISLRVRDGLRPKSARGGRVVIFDVPAKLLAGGGDFQLVLSGVNPGSAEEVGRYYFRVVGN